MTILSRKSYSFFLVLIFLFLISKLYSQQNSRLIKTNPSGADILDDKNVKIGTTPFFLDKLDKKISAIKIVKENYYPIEMKLFEKRNKNSSFFQLISDCSTCLIGIEENDYVLKLTKTFKEYDATILVGIEDPILEIDENSVIGEINGSKKKLKDKDIYRYLGYPQNMQFMVLNSFKDSYITAQYFSDKISEEDVSNLQNPKVIFKPIVKKLNFNLEGRLLRDYSGKCSIDCEWQLYDLSNLNTPISSFLVTVEYYRTGNNYELILHEMIALSEIKLLETESLYNILAATEKKHLEQSKGEKIKIALSTQKIHQNLTDMLKKTSSSVVTVETEKKFGSGVFISDNGYIITNYHVIEGEKTVFVRIDKEKKIKAEIIKSNRDFDLAILKVDVNSKGLSFNKNSTNLGEDVYAIGTPLDKKLQQSISKGIISGYREFNGVNFIQMDTNINSGNSGGPLLNSKGEIIGINTLKATGENVAGIGFSIPSSLVLKMLNIVD